ncbi:MAG: FTR1 family protein [Planctomycetota bacterium]
MRTILNIFAAIAAGVFLTVLLYGPAQAAPFQNQEDRSRDVHRVVGLLDYLSADYSGAVENGIVISPEEYDEQVAFADEAATLMRELDASAGKELVSLIAILQTRVQTKASNESVQDAVRIARKSILERFDIRLAPEQTPSLARGKELYIQNCMICHGERGDAKTQRASELKPPPLSFLSDKAREALSPYHSFNVTTFGLAGTAMASFDAIPARERWDIAFYISSLRAKEFIEKNANLKIGDGGVPPADLPSFSLAELANSSDQQIEARLLQMGRPANLIESDLAWLRSHFINSEGHVAGRLGSARVELQKLVDQYRSGKQDDARRAAFDIYLRYVEPVEAPLAALDRSLVTSFESGFVALRTSIKNAEPAARVARIAEELDRDFVTAESLLLQGGKSKTFSFIASFLILFREGIEAALIIATMLGLLRKIDRKESAKVVHFGWTAALVCGLATWFAARAIIQISAAERELIEGIVGLLAAGMLAYTSYWILSRSDTKRWIDFLKQQITGAVTNRGSAALFGIAFVAVYREAFETVLFYEALLTEPSADTTTIALGALAATAFLFVAIWGIFKLSAKLPLKQFFTISGALLYILAFVFAGSAIHALIEGGYIDPRPIRFPRIEWLGVYPDMLSVTLQSIFIVAVAAGIWFEFRGRKLQAARI